MRKITKAAIAAFNSATPFKQDNTTIKVLPNVTIMLLYNNEIAYRYNDPEKTLSITTAGWDTPTTKERLNSIDGVNVSTKKGQLYLNGEIWDGGLIDIK